MGTRSGLQFRALGIGSAFAGVAVHDRYVVHDEPGNFTADVQHQLCCAHLLRDLVDASEIYPDANWPVQCHRALQGLIHEANLARAAGGPVIAAARREELVREFRDGVLVGLKEVARIGGSRHKQPPARALLEDLDKRHDDVRNPPDITEGSR